MIGERDRVELPVGVEIAGDSLYDDVRGTAIPLNPSARVIIAAPTVDAMAQALERAYGLERDIALADARAFAASLNDKWLLNVRAHRRSAALLWRWIVATLVLRVPARWPARRESIATETRVRAVLSTARAVAPAAVAGSILVALAVAVVDVNAAAVAAALIAIGVTAHESGHAVGLHGVPAFVARRALTVRVVHRPLTREREVVVAALGPLAGLTTGALGLAAALALDTRAAAVAGGVMCVHALGLTVVSPDGRRVCGAL